MAKVLVVDDDVSIITLLQRVITKKGHQIIIARNGREGLAQAQAEVPDLILTDFRMPDMEGGELVLLLRDDPRLAQIPLVIMSGTHHPELNGLAQVLSKPFELKEIYSLLDQFFK